MSGTIVDASNAEELIGATVQVQNTGTGTVTDISGYYQLSLAPGSYNLVYSYVSYASKTVEGVNVEAGKATRVDIALESSDVQLQEVVVQAEQINNNEVSLLKLQQKSFAVQDGISISEIRRIGASNSAESVKGVTGASVEGGKYVVMRGLGDRYSLSQLNGVNLPSSDPYRNSVSLDLIPTSIIENIVTTKTFTPDQPGNFTGGNVNISTRSIPDEFFLTANVSLGYNTQATFNDNFLTDPINGSTDWLGYDDGSRALPEFLEDEANREALRVNNLSSRADNAGAEFDEARRVLEGGARGLGDRSFIPVSKTPGLNTGYQLSFGDRKSLLGRNFGYTVGANYSRNFTHYTDRQLNVWALPGNTNSNLLIPFFQTEGTQSNETVGLGAFATMAYQLSNNTELSLNYTYNNDAETSAAFLEGIWPGAISIGHTYQGRNISYVQRELSNLQLNGKHSLPALNAAKIDWVLGYVTSAQSEPDTRIMANNITNSGIYEIRQAEYDRPFHFFRELDDTQFSGKLDIEIPFGEEKNNKLKFGLLGNRKERNFGEQRYQLEEARNTEAFTTFREAAGDFDTYFGPNNTGVLGQNEDGSYNIGGYFSNQTLASNAYTGFEQVLATYLMGVFQLNKQLKAVGGVRLEKTDFEVISASPSDPVGEIDELDLLPSLNLIYAINDKANLRVSGSRTLARPNMRELAPFVSFDFIGGFINSGNPDLERTQVWNADLRYELFPTAGELFAVSAFYKDFTDPIQRRLIPAGSSGQIRYINVDRGILYGAELEFRKNLESLSPLLTNFKFSANFTYTISEVDLTEEELSFFRLSDPNPSETRPFQAQSPFIVNTNLSYFNPEAGFEATLYANMYGKRLFYNGFGGLPDVYEVQGDGEIPTPDLRINIQKTVLDNFNVGFRVENILDASTFRFIEYQDATYNNEVFKPGRTFVLSLGYKVGQ
ncbi:MAG: TonB-dependent receptor domain-containing protein [Cyclobacteriaceae bacterium]